MDVDSPKAETDQDQDGPDELLQWFGCSGGQFWEAVDGGLAQKLHHFMSEPRHLLHCGSRPRRRMWQSLCESQRSFQNVSGCGVIFAQDKYR